jgi:hypothetical protein
MKLTLDKHLKEAEKIEGENEVSDVLNARISYLSRIRVINKARVLSTSFFG